jgi:hypothetical protein
MNDTPLETRQLPNGMTLQLVNLSRPQTADRWIVALEARIDIPVDTHSLSALDGDRPALETLRRVLGPCVTYVSRKQRVFVPSEDKAQLLQTFQDEFCRNTLPYLALPAFPARFILKQYQAIRKQRSWAPADPGDPDQND